MKIKRIKTGFSMIEILVVVGITLVLAVMGTISYVGLREKKGLDSMAIKIAADLKAASEKSKAQENNMGWGIRFVNGSGGITDDYYQFYSGSNWTGSSCTLSTAGTRTNLRLVNFSSPASGVTQDIIFAKGTGQPINSSCANSSSTITITNNKGSKTITVNSNGRIDYE